MPETKFGISQIKNATPAWATNIFRIALYTGGIITILVGSFSQIPAPLKATIMEYTTSAIMVVHAISKLFGISIPDDPTNNSNVQK